MPIRKNLAESRDPYLPWQGPREAAVCKRCGAIYHHKRWSLEGPSAASQNQPAVSTLCPACRKIRDRFSGGVITLSGDFLIRHRDQILGLVLNQEARAKRINPLERIISIKDLGRGLEIQTTSDRFAQRIGREIERAYKGRAIYHWSRDDKFVRVEWHRARDGSGRKEENHADRDGH